MVRGPPTLGERQTIRGPVTTNVLNYDLQKIIRLIPGYDPFTQSGDCWFDEETAANALEFVQECCTFSQGEKAGEPFLLEAWQQAIIANLFGWKRPNGTRRYRECFVFVPRGNGKSELAAVMVLVVGFMDDEPGAQLYSAAAKRDQTRFVFDPVCKMIANEPELASRSTVMSRAVQLPDGVYRTIAADAITEHGGNTHLAVVDELHAQPNRALVDVLKTSMIKRRQPLLVHLTTSDYERPSICNEKHDYAKKVAQNSLDRDLGVDDGTFLPVIYEAALEDDWEDPKIWAMANPNLGVSIDEEAIAELCESAKNTPAFLNTFLQLHLNVRTQQSVRLIPMDQWDACATEIDMEALKGQPCYGGLDLATVSDLAALVLAFPGDDDMLDLLAWFFCPEEQAQKRTRTANVPYMTWAKQGFLDLTPQNSIDYRYIRERINALSEVYDIREIGFDPYNATHLCTLLRDEDGLEMIEHRQGMLSMGPPTKEVLRMVADGRIRHGGNPVLRWNANNVSGKRDHAGNVKPDKETSADKIDGFVAMVMAIGRTSGRTVEHDSFYETHGMEMA